MAFRFLRYFGFSFQFVSGSFGLSVRFVGEFSVSVRCIGVSSVIRFQLRLSLRSLRFVFRFRFALGYATSPLSYSKY